MMARTESSLALSTTRRMGIRLEADAACWLAAGRGTGGRGRRVGRCACAATGAAMAHRARASERGRTIRKDIARSMTQAESRRPGRDRSELDADAALDGRVVLPDARLRVRVVAIQQPELERDALGERRGHVQVRVEAIVAD